LLDGDIDKFTETMKQVEDKINPTVTGNSVQNNINNPNINVSNPDININNPDINIPSSVGKYLPQAASSIGIGAATAAGIIAMLRITNSFTPVTRALMLGGGGLIGAGLYVLGNSVNSVIQNTINSYNNYNRKW
jgi:hypothetical protein